MNAVYGNLADKRYPSQQIILRVRSTDDNEFWIKLVSINSVLAALTISWSQASVRSNAPGRRGHKCRRGQILMYLRTPLFLQRIGIPRTLPTMFQSLNSTAYVKNITSDDCKPDILPRCYANSFWFFSFFSTSSFGKDFALTRTGLLNYARIHWTFSYTKNTCWKCSDIFKGIVLLKVNL